MPTLLGLLAASAIGFVVEDLVRSLLGLYPALIASIVVSYPAYAWTKRFLANLRDG